MPPKEYTLGVEVFARDASYDPRTDPVVRVQARRLRYKRPEYYAAAGKADGIEIDLPKGAYALVFHVLPAAPQAALFRFKGWRVAAGVALALTVAAAAAEPPKAAFDIAGPSRSRRADDWLRAIGRRPVP